MSSIWILLSLWPALIKHFSVVHAQRSLSLWRLLLNDTRNFLVLTVLCDAHSRVYLALHGLILALSLHKVPIRRLVRLVSYLLRLFMGLSIVIPVKDICVIDRQLPRLLLRQVFFLVLIDFDLSVDLFECTGVHLC